MNILLVTQYFRPDNFRINELFDELIKRGHIVTIITGKPNYPKGKFYKGLGLFSPIKSSFSGATIYRLPIIPRGNASSLRLFLNYLSFAIIGSLFSLFHNRKYDFSFVYAVSPITTAIPAIVHKKFYGTKIYLWVQDLWPDSVTVTQKVTSDLIISILNRLVSFIYNSSDKIYYSSKEMKDSISKYLRHTKNRIELDHLPNWIEDEYLKQEIDRDKYKDLFNYGFVIMFTGNIGFAQDIPSVIQAIKILKNNKSIKFVFIGEGSEVKYFKQKIEELNLQDTVILLGSYPQKEIKNLIYHADVLLLQLRNRRLYSCTVPSKLQTYMGSAKPIVGMVNGETADIIKNSGCGVVVTAEDYDGLTKEINQLLKLDKSVLEEMGQNGYRYCVQNFNKRTIINKILKQS